MDLMDLRAMKCIESLGSIDLHMNHVFMREGDIEISIRKIRHFEYQLLEKKKIFSLPVDESDDIAIPSRILQVVVESPSIPTLYPIIIFINHHPKAANHLGRGNKDHLIHDQVSV